MQAVCSFHVASKFETNILYTASSQIVDILGPLSGGKMKFLPVIQKKEDK